MEKIDKDVLRKCRPYLTNNIEMDLLWDVLPGKGIFSDVMIEKFKAEKTNTDQARMMLTELPTRGPRVFELFLEALKESEQSHIVDEIRRTQLKLRPEDDTDTSDSVPGDRFISKGILNIKVSATPKELRDKLSKDLTNVYRMESSPKGYMLIINNEKFFNEDMNRDGTNIDRDNLEKLFTQLDYKVEIKNNLTGEEIIKAVNEFVSKPQHNRVDSCVFCILTHGLKDVVKGIDNKDVQLDYIMSSFNKSVALRSKPKLFIIQACRGAKKDVGVPIQVSDNGQSKDETDSIPEHRDDSKEMSQMMDEKCPNFTDFLIGFSTFPGYVSWRNPEKGSWYIQALCETFNDHAHEDHVLDMMVKVNRKISKFETAIGQKMTPNPSFTLHKAWYFLPDGVH